MRKSKQDSKDTRRLALALLFLLLLMLVVALTLHWWFGLSSNVFQRCSEVLTMVGGLIWIVYSLSGKIAKAMDQSLRVGWLRTVGVKWIAASCGLVAFPVSWVVLGKWEREWELQHVEFMGRYSAVVFFLAMLVLVLIPVFLGEERFTQFMKDLGLPRDSEPPEREGRRWFANTARTIFIAFALLTVIGQLIFFAPLFLTVVLVAVLTFFSVLFMLRLLLSPIELGEAIQEIAEGQSITLVLVFLLLFLAACSYVVGLSLR